MAKIDDLIKKYPQVRATTARVFNEEDKTPTKKYLEYIFKYWVTTPTYEKLSSKELCKIVMEFEDLLPYIENKDIYNKQYLNIHQVMLAVSKGRELKDEKTFVREDHIEVLIENDDYFLIKPLTLKGSIKYGAETKWCTTQSSGAHFKNYTSRGYLYYLISKKERNKNYNKLAFSIDRKINILNEEINIFNQLDTNISENVVLQNGWSTFEIFEILMKIRTHAYEQSILEKTKKDVESVILKLKSIDLDNFMKNVDYVNKYENTGKEYKEKLDNLLNVLSEKMKF